VEHATREAVPARRELPDLDVLEVFRQRWGREQGGEPPPDVLSAFTEAWARAADEGAP